MLTMKQFNNVPNHIAIIMDGNRRWAKEQGLPALAGHEKVANEILESLIEHAAKRGVKYMTFWAWSTENWERDQKEVSGIMKLFKYVIKRRSQKLHEKGVRVKVIGDISKFEPEIREALENVVEQTKNNQTITAIFALNYGGRDEIVRAINKMIYRKYNSPPPPLTLRGGERGVTKEEFSNYLDTAGIPDPELIVRTGGEQRLSGFLLWQSEYSELYFAPWFMPEFTPEKLDRVIEYLMKRQRRFGR